MPTCWVEVNRDALKHNLSEVQQLIGLDTSIIAVVKANAYGHGAVETAKAFVEAGAAMLAVTRVEEALVLREAGITTPILLLTPAMPDESEAVIEHDLTACLSALDDAIRLSEAAQKQNKTVRAHLKVDTGMGRLGTHPDETIDVAQQAMRLPGIELEALWTHFAFATEREATLTHVQYNRFQTLVHQFTRATSASVRNCHCANSAALLRFPAMRLSRVRPGTILYGQFPSDTAAEAAQQQGLKLRDTFAVKARVVAVRTLLAGQSVGYGGEWRASRPTKIATIAVGYADGLTQEPNTRQNAGAPSLGRTLRQAGKQVAQTVGLRAGDSSRTVLLRDQRVPIIGRIAMQECSIDLSGLEGVSVGEEVTVSMRRTSTGAHLPRIYVND